MSRHDLRNEVAVEIIGDGFAGYGGRLDIAVLIRIQDTFKPMLDPFE
jgi:hypothetical protein